MFWVINQLQEKYSQEVLQQGGLTVKTSLDYTIQKMAEDSIQENEAKLASNLANNTALVYMDSQNGDVLAYV
ncbi:MAG: hypothetical protein Q8O99_05615 [bacterium]|nr:hypothetical protein [bacterium]